MPEQISDDRERRDQQHAHDGAAADAVPFGGGPKEGIATFLGAFLVKPILIHDRYRERRPTRFIEYSAKSRQRGTMPYQRSRGSR
jgi:hypothetical protein